MNDNDLLDIDFYKNYYSDLDNLTSSELLNHYINFGKNEGRFSSENQIKTLLNDNNFSIAKYKKDNSNIANLSNFEIIYHYIYFHENNLYSKYKINSIENINSSSLFNNIGFKTKKFTYKNIDEIDKFILIIDLPNLGGGTTFFIQCIINKYKTCQTFLILRKFENKYVININDEYLLNNPVLNEDDCLDFLNNYNYKIKKIFVNHTLNFSDNFIMNLCKINKEITYITHDYYLIFKNPQIHPDNVLKKILLNNGNESILNNFNKIITQNIGNLNVLQYFLHNKKDIIISELPDYRNSLNIYKTNNDRIIIGVIGFINNIKGEEIINELYDFINLNRLNMEIVIFGYIKNEKIKSCFYNSISHLNKLLVDYKPNILIESSLSQETYSYTLTLSMITKLPIVSFYKTYKCVVNNRLSNYEKSYFFNNIDECIYLIKKYKQDYFYTIEPIIYYNPFWDDYFMDI